MAKTVALNGLNCNPFIFKTSLLLFYISWENMLWRNSQFIYIVMFEFMFIYVRNSYLPLCKSFERLGKIQRIKKYCIFILQNNIMVLKNLKLKIFKKLNYWNYFLNNFLLTTFAWAKQLLEIISWPLTYLDK